MSDEKRASETDNVEPNSKSSTEGQCDDTKITSVSTAEIGSPCSGKMPSGDASARNDQVVSDVSHVIPTAETSSELGQSSDQALILEKGMAEKVVSEDTTGASEMEMVKSEEAQVTGDSTRSGKVLVSENLEKSKEAVGDNDGKCIPTCPDTHVAEECVAETLLQRDVAQSTKADVRGESGRDLKETETKDSETKEMETKEHVDEAMSVDEEVGVAESLSMAVSSSPHDTAVSSSPHETAVSSSPHEMAVSSSPHENVGDEKVGDENIGGEKVSETRSELERPLMGFTFNEDGELRDERGQRFEFQFYEDHASNQRRYERLGEMITDHVYSLLETECKLHRIYLPMDAEEDEPRSFIFASENALTTTDKLLVLIHGTGVVRAGQWARRLIINENIDKGTQISYIKRAFDAGYEVMVLNTNLNTAESSNQASRRTIRGCESAEEHAVYVWEHIIEPDVKAQHIAIVAHSYGGVVTTELALTKTNEFLKRVFAVAFTDSVHSLGFHGTSRDVLNFYLNHVQNWVSSNKPLDEPSKIFRRDDAPRVSAGHPQHEWTSWACMDSVFKFFDKQLAELNLDSNRSDGNRCTTL